MILEMLAQCNWTRPIYIAISVGDDNYINLGDNTITEGLAYRLTPFTTTIDGRNLPGVKNFDTKRTYENVMHRYKFGGLEQQGIYLDETVMRMCYTHRRIMAKLALELVTEGDTAKALEVLKYTEKMIPDYNVPHTFASGSVDMARAWLGLDKKAEAMKIIKAMWKTSAQYMSWYTTLEGYRFDSARHDCQVQFYIMQQLLGLAEIADHQWADQAIKELSLLGARYEQRGGSLRVE